MSDLSANITLCNQRGLHARASARFVALAGQYQARITVHKESLEAIGTSILGLMMLAAACGDELTIRAQGQDAQRALDALCALVANRFTEDA